MRFLASCADIGTTQAGFTGGEPFLEPRFLFDVTAAAVKHGMLFDRIMTNAVWFNSRNHLKTSLESLVGAGFDGTICVSVDAFHRQNLRKTAVFIREALRILGRPDGVSIACVSGLKERESGGKLRRLSSMLGGLMRGIRVHRIGYSAAGARKRLRDPWGKQWFEEDFCRGPGNVFLVEPSGDVKPCCGYVSHLPELKIGNISRDSAEDVMKNFNKNIIVCAIFKKGLSGIRRSLEKTGWKFPGRTEDHCYFCQYVLSEIPRNRLIRCLEENKDA